MEFDPGFGTSQPFTMFAFYKRAVAVDFGCLHGMGINGGGGATFIALEQTSSGPTGNRLVCGSGGSGDVTGVSPMLTNGAWEARCITWDGGTAGVNGNGRLWAGVTKIIDSTFTFQVSSQGNIFYGYNAYGPSINGKMALLKLWDVVLSDAQIIAQVAQAAPVVTGAHLIADWRSVSDFTDSSGHGNTGTNTGSITFDAADNPTFGSGSYRGFFAARQKLANATRSFKRRFHAVLLPDGYLRRPSGLLAPV
jgi:hypothetical protein